MIKTENNIKSDMPKENDTKEKENKETQVIFNLKKTKKTNKRQVKPRRQQWYYNYYIGINKNIVYVDVIPISLASAMNYF